MGKEVSLVSSQAMPLSSLRLSFFLWKRRFDVPSNYRWLMPLPPLSTAQASQVLLPGTPRSNLPSAAIIIAHSLQLKPRVCFEVLFVHYKRSTIVPIVRVIAKTRPFFLFYYGENLDFIRYITSSSQFLQFPAGWYHIMLDVIVTWSWQHSTSRSIKYLVNMVWREEVQSCTLIIVYHCLQMY